MEKRVSSTMLRTGLRRRVPRMGVKAWTEMVGAEWMDGGGSMTFSMLRYSSGMSWQCWNTGRVLVVEHRRADRTHGKKPPDDGDELGGEGLLDLLVCGGSDVD